jgi:hypothetical protein
MNSRKFEELFFNFGEMTNKPSYVEFNSSAGACVVTYSIDPSTATTALVNYALSPKSATFGLWQATLQPQTLTLKSYW